MKRRLRALIPLVAMLALLPPPAAAAEKLTLVLDWFVNPDHAPIFVAKELGYFKEAGLDVDIKAPADPNDPPKMVAAGKADLAISYEPQLHMQVDAGLPVMRVATLVGTPLSCLLTLRDGPIKTIGDLKGRTIGYSVGGFEDAILRAMLEKHGLKLSDVKLVNVNFSLSPALVSQKVDAVIGAYRNFELNQLDILKRPGRAFYVEEEGVPSYDELIVIANRKDVKRPAIREFVRALGRGVQYLVNHPDESWKLFLRGHKDLNDELNRRAWRDTLPRFALRPAALDRGRYERFAEFLKKQGLIKKVPPVDSYAVEVD